MNLGDIANRRRLGKPVPASSLHAFRIGFGLLLAYYFVKSMMTGLLHLQYIRPAFQFTYPGFHWISPWAGNGMYWHYAFLTVCALLLALGIAYRFAAAGLFLGFTYVFLLDVARYQNHIYFTLLLCAFFVFMPKPPRLWPFQKGRAEPENDTIPVWWLYLFRFQIGIVYFFGGIAKINADWLVRGEPMATWLQRDMAAFLPGFFLEQTWTPVLMSWGGMLLDLFLFPALCWRRTRTFALLAMLAFHLSNSVMFRISIFPWLMIWATLLFLPASWPTRFKAWLDSLRGKQVHSRPPTTEQQSTPAQPMSQLAFVCVLLFCFVQLLLPLRHWLYPGPVTWTEEGHRFAWRMKLREKTGNLQFFLVDKANNRLTPLKPENLLDRRQQSKMLHDPHLLKQFCQKLSENLRRQGQSQAEIKVISSVSLNGRPAQPIVGMTTDMAKPQKRFGYGDWIVPLRPVPDVKK